MKTKKFMLERMTIDEFSEKHGLVMEIHERSNVDSPDRFYAHFERSDIAENGFLVGKFGNGPTPDEAINEYSEKISGKVLVIGAFAGSRREFLVPILEPRCKQKK